MTLSSDDRARLGRKLRLLRMERGWHQEDVAPKLDLSVGTVQAAENNKWKVGVENLDKYAALFGTSVQRILRPDDETATIQPTNPILADLNIEHLLLARRYMRGFKIQRQAVEILLGETAHASDIAQIVTTLDHIAETERAIVEVFGGLLMRGDLLRLLADRLARDPNFERSLREQLASLDQFPTPPPDPPRRGRSRPESK